MKWQRSVFSSWIKKFGKQELSKRAATEARKYIPGAQCGFLALASWALIKRKHRESSGMSLSYSQTVNLQVTFSLLLMQKHSFPPL